MPASNTKDCFREFIGQRVKGCLFDALPPGKQELANGTKTLVFEDGRGLTIAANGSYWIDSAEVITRALGPARDRLQAAQRDMQDLIELAGATP